MEYEPRQEDIGMSSQSFYKNTNKNSRNNILKRKLNSACESVKSKRTQDLVLSEKTVSKNLLSEPIPILYRVFNKQSEALDFAMNWENFRVFAIELDNKGRRNFVSCHPKIFWKILKAKPPDLRFAYEVIGENMPSKVSKELLCKKCIFAT